LFLILIAAEFMRPEALSTSPALMTPHKSVPPVGRSDLNLDRTCVRAFSLLRRHHNITRTSPSVRFSGSTLALYLLSFVIAFLRERCEAGMDAEGRRLASGHLMLAVMELVFHKTDRS